MKTLQSHFRWCVFAWLAAITLCITSAEVELSESKACPPLKLALRKRSPEDDGDNDRAKLSKMPDAERKTRLAFKRAQTSFEQLILTRTSESQWSFRNHICPIQDYYRSTITFATAQNALQQQSHREFFLHNNGVRAFYVNQYNRLRVIYCDPQKRRPGDPDSSEHTPKDYNPFEDIVCATNAQCDKLVTFNPTKGLMKIFYFTQDDADGRSTTCDTTHYGDRPIFPLFFRDDNSVVLLSYKSTQLSRNDWRVQEVHLKQHKLGLQATLFTAGNHRILIGPDQSIVLDTPRET